MNKGFQNTIKISSQVKLIFSNNFFRQELETVKIFFRGAEIILTISPGEMKSCITLYKYLYEAVTVTSETSPKSLTPLAGNNLFCQVREDQDTNYDEEHQIRTGCSK